MPDGHQFQQPQCEANSKDKAQGGQDAVGRLTHHRYRQNQCRRYCNYSSHRCEYAINYLDYIKAVRRYWDQSDIVTEKPL